MEKDNKEEKWLKLLEAANWASMENDRPFWKQKEL